MKATVIKDGKVKWHQRVKAAFQFKARKFNYWWKQEGMFKTMFMVSYAIGIAANIAYIKNFSKK